MRRIFQTVIVTLTFATAAFGQEQSDDKRRGGPNTNPQLQCMEKCQAPSQACMKKCKNEQVCLDQCAAELAKCAESCGVK